MNESDLKLEMQQVPLARLGRENAARAIAGGLSSRRATPRRWRGPLAAGVGLIVAFAFTAPGQATVDWIAEGVHLRAAAANSHGSGNAVEIGRGTGPAGQPFSVEAVAYKDSGACLLLNPPGSGPEDGTYGGQAACASPEGDEPGSLGSGPHATDYFPLPNGGAIAFGLVNSETKSAAVTSPGHEDGEVDLFPLTGDITRNDGSVAPLPALTAYVTFLPPDVGDLARGAPASLATYGSDGSELSSRPLARQATPGGRIADCGPQGPGLPRLPCLSAIGHVGG